MIELDEAMRQRGDNTFSELLCRVRINSCTSADIDILRSREIALNYYLNLELLDCVTQEIKCCNKDVGRASRIVGIGINTCV